MSDMSGMDGDAMNDIKQAERETEVQSKIAFAIAQDMPRMLRSDMTRITEMITKYTGLEGTFELLCALVDAREKMALYSSETQSFGAPTMAGPGVNSTPFTEGRPIRSTEPQPDAPASAEPWAQPAALRPRPAAPAVGGLTMASGGRDVLLTEVLARTGFLSSSGRAKAAIRENVVFVNGAVQTNGGALLSAGEYMIRVGDGEEQAVTIT